MPKKQFVIIGVGRFGSSVAKSLHKSGYEVLAIDSSEEKIAAVAPLVTHAVQADSTDEEALRALGVRNFDVGVVAIGQDIQASILTTLILKELGIPLLIVKAQNELHGKVLTRIGADKIIYPERDMGNRVAHHLISPSILDYIELSDDYSIVELQAAPGMIGKSLKQMAIRAKYGCSVMAIKSGTSMNIAPQADSIVARGDVLVMVGSNESLQLFESAFSE